MVFILFMSPLNISFLNECNWCGFWSLLLNRIQFFLFTFNIKTAEALPSGKKQYPFIAAGTNGVNKCNGYINGRSNWFPLVWDLALPIWRLRGYLLWFCAYPFWRFLCYDVLITLNKLKFERGNWIIPSTPTPKINTKNTLHYNPKFAS